MKFCYPPGATPLDPDEVEGLIPGHISTQKQLNEWEETNILDAANWLFARHRPNLLTMRFLLGLHQRMFDKTWRWAGKCRRSDKNLGILWEQIPTQLKLLIDDLQFQLAHHSYSMDEIATRFHHRLVSIHPFPNGNGRHARLMTDALLFSQNSEQFTWGQQELITNNQARSNYITALRSADRGEYDLLLQFVRS